MLTRSFLFTTLIGAALAGELDGYYAIPYGTGLHVRDTADYIAQDGHLYVRAAKGGSRPSLSSIGHGASAVTDGIGNVGTGLTGITNFVDMFKHHKRDLEDLQLELVSRAAKGGSRPSLSSIGHQASAIGHGASAVTDGIGNVGTGLTGITNFVDMFRHHKRDLEDLQLELISRAAKAPSLSSVGKGAKAVTDGIGNVGTGLTGITDFVGMIKGNKGKRDLEDLDLELITRAAKGGRPSLSSIGHGAQAVTNGIGHVGDGLTGISNFVGMIKGNNKRDIEDLDIDLFARGEWDMELDD